MYVDGISSAPVNGHSNPSKFCARLDSFVSIMMDEEKAARTSSHSCAELVDCAVVDIGDGFSSLSWIRNSRSRCAIRR
jgi:hypothetical protein